MKYIFPFVVFSLFFFSGCGNDEERANINGANPTQNEQTYNGENQAENQTVIKEYYETGGTTEQTRAIYDFIGADRAQKIQEMDIDNLVDERASYVRRTADNSTVGFVVEYDSQGKIVEVVDYIKNDGRKVAYEDEFFHRVIDATRINLSTGEKKQAWYDITMAFRSYYDDQSFGAPGGFDLNLSNGKLSDIIQEVEQKNQPLSPEKQAILDEFEAKLRAGDIEGAINGLVVKENCGIFQDSEQIGFVFDNVFGSEYTGNRKEANKLLGTTISQNEPSFDGCRFWGKFN